MKNRTLPIVLIVSTFLLSACSNVEKIQHIEVFFIETSEKSDEGLFETTGYKKVNAITSIEEGKNYIKTDIKSIEDFYGTERNYIETEIIHSTSTLSGVTQALNNKNRKKKLQEPSTILISDEDVENNKLKNAEIEGATIEHFSLDTLTEEDKEKVKEHVLSFMNNF